jgi:hypothetical protein
MCNWKGKGLPRKIMNGSMYKESGERKTHYEKLRGEGGLQFVRIYLSGSERQKEIAESEIWDLMVGDSETKKNYILIILEGRLDDDIKQKISKINSVKKISVH